MKRVVSSVLLASACQGDACQTLPPCPDAPRSGCPVPEAGTFVDPVVHLGRGEGDSFIEILDVVVDFPIVYACTGTQGLTVWDASRDARPRLLTQNVGPSGVSHGSFPRCQHISLDRANDRLLLTNRGDEVQKQPFLWRYDVSDPARPRAELGWVPGVSVEGVVLDGDRVIAATHTSGVFLLEDPGGSSAYSIAGSFADPESDAWQPVLMDANTLLVAEGATGLRTYDLSSGDPQLLSTTPLPGASRDLVVDGNLAYVASSTTLAVVDVTDPAAPVVRSETATLGTNLALALGPDDTVVTAEWDEVRGYDVSNPDAPVQVFGEILPTDDAFSRVLGLDVARAERRIYAGEWTGLQVLAQEGGGAGPDVWATPGTVQFGNVPRGEREDQVLVVRNSGNRDLTVHDVITPQSISVDDSCFQVAAGGANAIEVSFESRGDGELASHVKVCSDDPDEPEFLVPVSGNVEGRGVGDQVPGFRLVDLNGVEWTDEQLLGNVAVLAYFATF